MDNKQLLDEVLVITGIIKFKLSVISRAEGVSTIIIERHQKNVIN